MSLKFTSAYAEAKLHGVKILVYARSGIGKTMLAGTYDGPTCIAAAEPGLLSLSAANQVRVFGKGKAKDIDAFVITTLDDLIEFYELMLRDDCPYELVFIDSITEIGEKILANALKQASDPRQAYGEMLEKMTDAFKKFRDLPGKHVVFVAKETPNKDGCIPLHIPAMPGSKFGHSMPYLVDEVFHMDVGETPDKTKYRYLQTQPDVNFDAKDRSGALEDIEEPNLSKLINKIVS